MTALAALLAPLLQAVLDIIFKNTTSTTTITENTTYANQDRAEPPTPSVGRLLDRVRRDGLLGR